jgi:hypothetical protein
MLEAMGDYALRGLAKGAKVQTPVGPWQVQDLRVGDLIDTLDEGPLPILWMGQTELFVAAPAVRIAMGTIANATPLLLAPDHLVMIDGSDCELLFGEAEVLVKASDLVGLPGITYDKQKLQSSYFHFMLDTHQLIIADGVPVESFHPGLVRNEEEITELKSLLQDTLEQQDIDAIFAEEPILYILTENEAAVLRNLRLKLHGAHQASVGALSAA